MKKILVPVLCLLMLSLKSHAQRRFGFWGGINLSPSVMYSASYLAQAANNYTSLDELWPYYGTRTSSKSFLHKHAGFWWAVKKIKKIAIRAELGLISFGNEEQRDGDPVFAIYPWNYNILPSGNIKAKYTFRSHYLYAGPSAEINIKDKLNAEAGFFFWFQDKNKKFINLSPTFNTTAVVIDNPRNQELSFSNLVNPDSRSAGLMGRLGINYNFERNFSLHLRYQHFITTANKHTDWGRVYNKGFTIDFSYQFGKRLTEKINNTH